MNKCISGFVLGLIFSLLGALASYILWIVCVLVAAFSKGALDILVYLPLINIATYVLSLVGCCFCFGKPKVAGIIMLIAGALSSIILVTIFVMLKAFDVMYILFVIPTLIILLSSMLSFLKARKAKRMRLIPLTENKSQENQ